MSIPPCTAKLRFELIQHCAAVYAPGQGVRLRHLLEAFAVGFGSFQIVGALYRVDGGLDHTFSEGGIFLRQRRVVLGGPQEQHTGPLAAEREG